MEALRDNSMNKLYEYVRVYEKNAKINRSS